MAAPPCSQRLALLAGATQESKQQLQATSARQRSYTLPDDDEIEQALAYEARMEEEALREQERLEALLISPDEGIAQRPLTFISWGCPPLVFVFGDTQRPWTERYKQV